MRHNRETVLLASWVFLAGMLVPLVIHELWGGTLGTLGRDLVLMTLLLLVATAFVLWWRLSRGEAGVRLSQTTMTLEEWNLKNPAGRDSAPEPPSPKGIVEAREHRGTGPRIDAAPLAGGGRQPVASAAPQPTRDPNPPAPRPPAAPFQTQSDSWDDSYTASTFKADASRLIEIWDGYCRSGARFNDAGLLRHIETAGLQAEVIPGNQFGGGESVLAVDLKDGSGILYLLPDFAKPPRAIEEWFQSRDSGSRMARIQRLVRPATARRSGGRINLESKGEVE